MASFEDILLQSTHLEEIQINEFQDHIMTRLYSNADFVDMIQLFRQTKALNLDLFKKVLFKEFREINCFIDPDDIIRTILTEISDIGNVYEFAEDFRGIIDYVKARVTI